MEGILFNTSSSIPIPLSHYIVVERNKLSQAKIWCLVEQGLRELARLRRVLMDISRKSLILLSYKIQIILKMFVVC